MWAKCEIESILNLYEYSTISKSFFYPIYAQSAASSSLQMECCTFPLHKRSGHILNEWLAHLYNPQLQSQQL